MYTPKYNIIIYILLYNKLAFDILITIGFILMLCILIYIFQNIIPKRYPWTSLDCQRGPWQPEYSGSLICSLYHSS